MTPPKRPYKRGQVAVENIFLYAAVIVVVVIGIILVWQSGIFKPQPGKKGFVGFSQVVPTDWAASTTDKVYLSLRAEGDAPLVVNRIGVNASFPRVQCELGPDQSNEIFAGGTRIFKIVCSGLNRTYDIGEEYEMDVVVNYTNTLSKRTHISVGKIYGLMEYIEGDWEPATTTTTTEPTTPQCFERECNKSGEMDPENCGEIIYGFGLQQCIYCPQNPAYKLNGKSVCWYNGQCGKTCNSWTECNPQNDPLNVCTECVDNKCQENPDRPQCGPCPPFDYGTFNSSWCNQTTCAYCFHEWVQRSTLIGDGYDSYMCSKANSCGEACDNTEYDDYKQCKVRCLHCQADPATGQGNCTQGDCGKRCGPGSSITECQLGCVWCNMTAYRCEPGDCGKLCSSQSDCVLGCDVCDDGVCVKKEIGISIRAHNGTGGKIVKQDQDIFLDVSGSSVDGIERLIVSNGTLLPMSYEDCNQFVTEWEDEDLEDDPTNMWFSANNIWWQFDDIHMCSPPTDRTCSFTWTTSESNVSRYCYFAMAQKYTTSGGGRWSRVATDWMQVGEINVYLITPKPGGNIG
jgi:hypothetical protein